MLNFLDFLKESADEGAKLKHIHHAEDRPFLHGKEGFEHAEGALRQAHEDMKSGTSSNNLTEKFDGSPSIVFGKHPETGKFFVASKSAFNKNPKINYTPEDIDRNHGHAPGLSSKLKDALAHLPKVAPKKGVYQGDLMHTSEDHQTNPDGSVSFTPNTITYTAHGKEAEKVKRSKVGVVVHTKYEGKSLDDMKATPNVNDNEFKEHPDVHIHTANFDTKKVSYSPEAQQKFEQHMHAARDVHLKNPDMYKHIARHGGDAGHLATYINQTVRDGSTPNTKDFKKHVMDKYQKMADKVKTDKSKELKLGEGRGQLAHIDAHTEHYDAAFKMHSHLQQAKNTLVNSLESSKGGYDYHINGEESKPEGYVVNHKGEPTKLVNRAEFARQNLLKVRK
jgi:hypothetical protein